MAETPLVSVIVLSHRWTLMLEAIESVNAQTYDPARVELLLKHNKGPYYVEKWNQAWQGAAGKYLVFLPDDDWLHPTFLERHVGLAEATGADMVYSDFLVHDRLQLQWHLPPFTRESLRVAAVPFMTFLVRQDFWRGVGGWDGVQQYADWDVSIRMWEQRAKVAHLTKEFLWTRRNHPLSGSVMMSDAEHTAGLAQLKGKHRAFFAGTE